MLQLLTSVADRDRENIVTNPKPSFQDLFIFIHILPSLLGLHTFKICMLSAAGYISIAEQIWIINKRQFCAAWKRWLYQTMHFAPYNIHVCISKGNVVYEAHVIMLQLNCKDRNGKFTTEFHVTLYSRSYKLHLVLFYFHSFLEAFRPLVIKILWF